MKIMVPVMVITAPSIRIRIRETFIQQATTTTNIRIGLCKPCLVIVIVIVIRVVVSGVQLVIR